MADNRHKNRLISAIAEIFSLRAGSYEHFIVQADAAGMFQKNWEGVGRRLSDASIEIEHGKS